MTRTKPEPSKLKFHYRGYAAPLEYDPEAKVFHGRVEGIRDVVTFQGSTLEEASEEFRASVEDYLEMCQQRGEAPEVPVDAGAAKA